MNFLPEGKCLMKKSHCSSFHGKRDERRVEKNNTGVVLAVSATEGLIRAVPCHFLD